MNFSFFFILYLCFFITALILLWIMCARLFKIIHQIATFNLPSFLPLKKFTSSPPAFLNHILNPPPPPTEKREKVLMCSDAYLDYMSVKVRPRAVDANERAIKWWSIELRMKLEKKERVLMMERTSLKWLFLYGNCESWFEIFFNNLTFSFFPSFFLFLASKKNVLLFLYATH